MEIKIELDEARVAELEKRVEDAGFDSLSEYVGFLIDQVAQNDGDDDDGDDEVEVREKLKRMGYL